MPDNFDSELDSLFDQHSDPSYDQTELPFEAGELPVGFDPLIVNPIIATGETGAIARPGDDRPAWVVGIFFAAFCALISGLVTVALTRDSGVDTASSPTPTAATGEPVDGNTEAAVVPDVPPDDQKNASSDTEDSGAAQNDTSNGEPLEASTPADSSVANDSIEAADDVRLPDVGQASIDGFAVDIESGCATHLPLAPNDADAQVSTYFFRTVDGEQRVVDRRFGDRDTIGAGLLGVDNTFVDVEDLGGSGAFVATFTDADGAPVEVAVNPGSDDGADCSDSLVTNEPAQFAFPYTRVVMFVCADGDQGSDLSASGTTSEGGRFSAMSNGDDTVTLTYRNAELGADFVDAAASSFESEGRLGYSGFVSNGTDSLDITVDFSVDRAGPCTAADLL